jgi:hypothetical protein
MVCTVERRTKVSHTRGKNQDVRKRKKKMEVGARSDAYQHTSDAFMKIGKASEEVVGRSGSRQEGNINGFHAFFSCGS